MPTLSDFFRHRADGVMDDGLTYIKSFHPKEYAQFQICLKEKNLNKCDKYEEIFQKLKQKSYMRIANKDIDPNFCRVEEFTEELEDIIEVDQRKSYNKCINSKKPLKFIAEYFDISSKHIKSNKELNIEINERYGIDINKNKYCDSVPLLNHINTSKNIIKKCQALVKRVNFFVKLRNKCLKE